MATEAEHGEELNFDSELENAVEAEIGEISPAEDDNADTPIDESQPELTGKDMADLLWRYIREANRYPLLTPEQEKALATRLYETRDPKARDILIKSNLRLVIKIALEFQKFWMKNLLDLIQEGNIGLMHAIAKFDPYRGIKLSYYASFWIKAYVLKFIMDNWKLVKIGTTQSQRKLFYNLRREKEKLRSLGFEPDPKLLAKNLNVQEREVIEMDQRLGGWDLSLDAPLKDGSDEHHKNFLPAVEPDIVDCLEDAKIKQDFREKLEAFKERMNPKELSILKDRLLAEKPATLQEIGDEHNLSRERVRQIEDRLIKKIRAYLKNPSVNPPKAVPEALLKLEAICEELLDPLELEVVSLYYFRFGRRETPISWKQLGNARTIRELNNGPLIRLEAKELLAGAQEKLLACGRISPQFISELPKKFRSFLRSP